MTKFVKARYVIILVVLATFIGAFTAFSAHHVERRNIYVLTSLSGRRSVFVYESVREAMSDEFSDKHRYNMVYVNLNSELSDTASIKELKRLLRDMIANGGEPDLFVIYGDFLAQAIAASDEPIFRNTPTICMGVIYPEYQENLLKKRENVTGFKLSIDVLANLRLMNDMNCERWVVTSLDTGYVDDYVRREIRHELKSSGYRYRFNDDLKHPDHYLSRSNRDTSYINIIPICTVDENRNYTDRERGIGFSWVKMFCCMNAQVTYLRLKSDPLADNAFKLSLGGYYAAVPDFFNSHAVDFMSSCAGGYLCPFPVMAKEVHGVVDAILFSGVDPCDVGWGVHHNDYWLDWNVVRNNYRYASQCPSYVKFIRLPWEDRSPKHYWLRHTGLPLLGLLIAILCVVIPLRLYILRKRADHNMEVQGRESEEITHLMTEIMSVTGAYLWKLSNGMVTLNNISVQRANIRRTGMPLQTLYRYLCEEDRHKVQAIFCESTNEVHELELAMQSPRTGHIHYLHVCISNVHNVMGNPYANGMFFVIDSQKERQRDIRDAFEQEEKSHLKETFLASMGHEIRTPLNAIVGFSRVLIEERKNLSPEELQTFHDVIEQNTNQLLELLNGVINFSVEAENSMKPVLQEINVAGLMDELYMTHSVIVPPHLHFRLARGDAEASIMSSRTSMRQVISNMMNNACKFTREGSITMGWEADAETVCIYVEDTGVGIKEEDIDKVFSKFYKTDSTTEGAGIGLPLCKKLVTGMGGTMKVRSTYGKGSRFEVRLPRVQRTQILASEVS